MQTPSIALNVMGTPCAQAEDTAKELLLPRELAQPSGEAVPATALVPVLLPSPRWFSPGWGDSCWQERLSRGAHPAHAGHCRLQ